MLLFRAVVFLATIVSALPEVDVEARTVQFVDCKLLTVITNVLHVQRGASTYCSSLLHIRPVTSTFKRTATTTTTLLATEVQTRTLIGGDVGGTVTATADTVVVVETHIEFVVPFSVQLEAD